MHIQTNSESIQQLVAVIEKKENRPKSVRVFVSGYACSGPKFGLVIDPSKDDDVIYEQEGLQFVMNEAVYEQFGDFKIEFQDGGFVVMPKDLEGGSGCSSCAGSCG
jgi:iron-sulfur cluster insertion protein